MATLALSVAGAAVGGALLPGGVSVLGAAISGATIGSQIGALAGTFVDQALFAASGQAQAVEGPRLSDLQITSSTEGTSIPRLYGRARLGGQIIWATALEEDAVTSEAGGGGKGAPSSSSSARTDYVYYGNFAVALCEGPITTLGRVWANGAELDLSQLMWRLHTGADDQLPDSLIAAREGASSAPAYRGIAYIVFERMPLADFGNRLPQLSFEVHRSVDPFEKAVRGVVMIPGSGEFVYSPDPVTRQVGRATAISENVHTRSGGTDWSVALDQLEHTLPNAHSVSLVVSWFGTDLRASHCEVRPAVDAADKVTHPIAWSVAGLTRASAPEISRKEGRAAYGGTSSDQTVIAAIRDLNARGHRVMLTPFILMDIADDNARLDPYSDAVSQPAYPWRGRITVSPAPGHAGTPDKTSIAAEQIAAFVGTAGPADFVIAGDAVHYIGPDEWSLRRMVLHYASLAAAAGGVEAFVIGSELRGLTQVRSSATHYPFVAALEALAADVKSILGSSTKVTYAADWSEYFGHHPNDGSGDVTFHLDPLWSSAHIDAIAIDCYWPLADWRDDDEHLDRLAGTPSIYDLAYLKSNVSAGEGFDWYYASNADRATQLRTPITDGAGKPWVFRFKDLKSWWLNAHYDRPGGIEAATPTAWVPQSKPFWFTEIGCPAVDKGANQPNVFVDPKSAESMLPHFSAGLRDDLMQRRYIQALVEAFDPETPFYVPGANPVSAIYHERMLDLSSVYLYAWDARPFPAFPANTNAWGDGENWRLGHWLNGRIAGQPLSSVVTSLLARYGFSQLDVSALNGVVTGFVIDRAMSAREALQPLELAFFFDSLESDGRICFRPRGAASVAATLTAADLVETRAGADLFSLTRAQETDLPASARIAHVSSELDYRQAIAETRRLIGASGRAAHADLALVMESEQASRTADAWLFEAWAARERAHFTLPPSQLRLEPGDMVLLGSAEQSLFRITGIGERGEREIDALSIDPSIYVGGVGSARAPSMGADVPAGSPALLFLDMPLLGGTGRAENGYVAATQTPWPGSVALYRSPADAGFSLAALARHPATIGTTLDALTPGPESRLDKAARVRVRLDFGTLSSATRLAMLGGTNVAAILSPNGAWEVVQFEEANLVDASTYELRTLLRGQGGTEAAMAVEIPPGATVVLLDHALTPVTLARDDIGLPLNWRFGPGNRDLGDASYVTEAHAFIGQGLKPLSPVQIRGERTSGDLALRWIRRTRIGGDAWGEVDVPLGEDSERYEIEILSGDAIVRTLQSTAPSVVYTAADQTADFGAPQSSIAVRIAQMGALGRGAARSAVV